MTDVRSTARAMGLDLRESAAVLAKHGRGGDTMLAHITPREVEILKREGGSGSKNPRTGLLEFFDTGAGGTDNGGGTGIGGGDTSAGASMDTGLGGQSAMDAVGNAGAAMGGSMAGAIGGGGMTGMTATSEAAAGLGFGNASQGLAPDSAPALDAPGWLDRNVTPGGIFGTIAKGLAGMVIGGPVVSGLSMLDTLSGKLGGPSLGGLLNDHGIRDGGLRGGTSAGSGEEGTAASLQKLLGAG